MVSQSLNISKLLLLLPKAAFGISIMGQEKFGNEATLRRNLLLGMSGLVRSLLYLCRKSLKISATRKKSPNVSKSCPKMISLEKWWILTSLQKLPKNVGDLGNYCYYRLWKIAQSAINHPIWSHCSNVNRNAKAISGMRSHLLKWRH